MKALQNQQLPSLGLLTSRDSKQTEDSKQGAPDEGVYYLGYPTVSYGKSVNFVLICESDDIYYNIRYFSSYFLILSFFQYYH